MAILINTAVTATDFQSVWSTGLANAIASRGFAQTQKSYSEIFTFNNISSTTLEANRTVDWLVPTDCRLYLVDLTVSDGTIGATYSVGISGAFVGPIDLSLTGAAGIVAATKALKYPTGTHWISLLSGDTLCISVANTGAAGTSKTSVCLTFSNYYTEV